MKEQLLDAVMENLGRTPDKWVVNGDDNLTFLEKINVNVPYQGGINISFLGTNINFYYPLLKDDKVANLIVMCKRICDKRIKDCEAKEIEKMIEFLKQ